MKDLTEGNTNLQTGYDTLVKADTEKLLAGADTLQQKSQEVNAGITQLQGKNDTNATQLLQGAKALQDAKKTLTDGTKQINKATGKLQSGVSLLASNSGALYSGAGQLLANSGTLSSGAGQLSANSSKLNSGAQELTSGIGTLSEGTADLKDGSDQVQDGIGELKDGAEELKDGQQEFYDDGITKLKDMVDKDLQDILDRLEAIQSDEVSYDSYSGKDSSMNGNVKFIIETASIDAPDAE